MKSQILRYGSWGIVVLHVVLGSTSQMKVARQPRATGRACWLHSGCLGRTDDVRLNLGMSDANASGSSVVPKMRLRPRERSNLNADGE